MSSKTDRIVAGGNSMRKTMTTEATEKFPCSKCGAKPGEACKISSGALKFPHAVRLQDFYKDTPKPTPYHLTSYQGGFVSFSETIDISGIIKSLYPGHSSESGFLQVGEKLEDVVAQDKNTLLRLGISYEQVADCLEYVTKRARHLCWIFSEENPDAEIWDRIAEGFVVGNLSISWIFYMGCQECPFGCEEETRKDITLAALDYQITNLDTKETIFCSELLPHLIRKHHFFEGHTKYRIDPVKAIRVLGIEKGVEYPVLYNTRYRWQARATNWIKNNSLDDMKKDFCQESDRAKIVTDGEILNFGKGIKAYLLGDKLVVFTDRGVEKDLEIRVKELPVSIYACGGAWELYEKISIEYVKENAYG